MTLCLNQIFWLFQPIGHDPLKPIISHDLPKARRHPFRVLKAEFALFRRSGKTGGWRGPLPQRGQPETVGEQLMKGQYVAAFGCPRPRRSLSGDGDLLAAEACLIADHGTSTTLTFQAVAHSDARRFALNRKVKLPAAAGGASGHLVDSMVINMGEV